LAAALACTFAITVALGVAPVPAFAKAKSHHLPTFTRANYATLEDNPNQYKGAKINISGQVFALPNSGTKGVTAVQMWMDPDNDTWNTIVAFRSSLLTPAPSDQDYLHIVGKVFKAYHYKNGFGVSETAVLVDATSVTETDEAAAEPPISSTGTTITSCAVSQYDNTSVDVGGTILDPSGASGDYDITVGVVSDGVRIGTAEDFENDVTPGQLTTWSTEGEVTAPTGPITCSLLSVKVTAGS
jgi:hypothetical protein